MMKLLGLLGAFMAGVTALPDTNGHVSYDGHRVYRVATRGRASDVKEKLDKVLPNYHQGNTDGNTFIDVVVPPSGREVFENLGLSYRVTHEDFGASIAAEQQFGHSSKWRRQEGGDNDKWFDSYHSYEDHIQYFKDLQESFPDNSEIVSAGESYEGRDIWGLHVWGDDGPGKPAILWYGTSHAREWIAAPVLEFITSQLIEDYQSGNESEVATDVLNSYDYYVLPFVNPDGFVYSQETDRMWRKTRHPPPKGANSSCYGIDVNRNYEFAWDSNDLGASTDPCDVDYRGESAASTIEVQNLDKFAGKVSKEQGIKLFIDWHNFGQYIMYPFSYNETIYPPELGKWAKLAAYTSRAILNHDLDVRTPYLFGPNGATLYPTTGSAPDHMYAVHKADFAYTIELRDQGDFGFVLPPEQIRPTAEEMWSGQKEMLRLMGETFFDGIGEV